MWTWVSTATYKIVLKQDGSKKHPLVILQACQVTCQVTLLTQIGNELFLEFHCYTVLRPVLGGDKACFEYVI